jgi:asparagine synthase (glutamine-hydrolysing)
MCGIFGSIYVSGTKNVDKVNEVKISHKKLKHRGPDWDGEFENNDVFLAHHRLSIIDPLGGSQPLIWSSASSDKVMVLCVNGEIYNYKQLKKEIDTEIVKLGKFPFEYKTESDCEVILALYNLWLITKDSVLLSEMLNRLDGMFSFILYDEINEKVLVVRDHMGITSLYYGYDKYGNIHISSEMKAFTSDTVPKHFPAGHYIYIDVKYNKLVEPHKYFSVLDYNVNDIVQYEDIKKINEYGDVLSNTVSSYKLLLHNSLLLAVKKRLQCDVPFGMLLSGGLDSSLICSLAKQVIMDTFKCDKKSWRPDMMKTFSIGLEGSPDLVAAQKVADFLNTEHYSFTFTIEEGLNAIRDVIYHLETYDVTTIRASIPMFLLSRRIKSLGVKMVLSGEGSDEIFGGYLYFLNAPNDIQHSEECINRVNALPLFDNLRANKSTMAWGVEARVPFLDKNVVELGLKMPAILKRNSNIEKWILRSTFDVLDELGNPKYLPDELLWRQKEQFSDGVGYNWIDKLKDVANKEVSDYMLSLSMFRYPYNTPQNKEEYYYRTIFDELFIGMGCKYTVQKWIPRTDWKGVGYDPSGRAQGTHIAKYS